MEISIHSPRVGRDHAPAVTADEQEQFQSTRPVWGETLVAGEIVLIEVQFQSTRPVWGETIGKSIILIEFLDFNPLAPCGARHRPSPTLPLAEKFQSTRPVWGETFSSLSVILRHIFQSTRPVWGETLVLVQI